MFLSIPGICFKCLRAFIVSHFPIPWLTMNARRHLKHIPGGIFKRQKSAYAEKDEEGEALVDEEEIENNIKEVNIIRSRVITEKWVAPIDLALSSVKNMHLRKLNWGNMTDMPSKMKATNTGNTVIVSAKWNNTRPHVRGGSLLSTYVFSQLHFHWGSSEHEGSEHRINGISYPLEMHAVFFKSLYLTQDVALTKEDGVVTVVYLFKLISETNEVLNLITSKLPDIQEPHSSTAIDPTPLSTLLYPFNEDYFMYWGKLQTTVCEHPVLWIISRHAFGVTQSQLKEFRNLLSYNDENLIKNFRDPCPLNERPVFHVNPSSNLDMVLLPGIVKQDLQFVTVMYNYLNECYNKYHAGNKNMSKNACGDTTKANYGKAVLSGSEKLTKYDYMYNTMQSSGIKILFLLREITNILHQRILQGGSNHPQNRGGNVLENKENIAEAICVGHLNSDSEKRNIRVRNMRRNTEPSILAKPKLCKSRNINNLVRLKQANSKHTAISNKQNGLMKNKTFSSFNRPNINLLQSDVNNTTPVDLSNCKHLFTPQNIRKPDKKLVSKIQSETSSLNRLKQKKDKSSLEAQDGTNQFDVPKKQTSKTDFCISDCRTTLTAENRNKKNSVDTISFKSLTKPFFKELATIREESRILRQETPSSLNIALVNEDKKNTVVDPLPSLNQFGLNATQDGDNVMQHISQTMLLEERAVPGEIQNCNPVNNENNTFGVKKLAALSKQLMNVFHLPISTDNECLCSLNTNSADEQETHLERGNHLLNVCTKQETNQIDNNDAKSIKHKWKESDGITVKNRMPISLNHQVMELVEDTGIETNTQETASVINDKNSFLSLSDTGDSQLIETNKFTSSNKKKSVENEPVAEQCDGHPKSHNTLNQLDVKCILGDTTNTQSNKPERVDEANYHGIYLIQKSVNAIKKLFIDEQHPSKPECHSVRNDETGILNEGGTNVIGRNNGKMLNEPIVIEDLKVVNYNSMNDIISSNSQMTQNCTLVNKNSCSVIEDYRNLKMKNNSSNFTSFNQHESHFKQNSFKTKKQINYEDVYVNETDNFESVGNTGNLQDVNSAEFSVEARQAVHQQGLSNEIKKTNYKHCSKDNEESYYNKNEYIYDNDGRKTIEQINEKILSLFGDKGIDDTCNINSESEKIMCKAVTQSFSVENLHVNTDNPALIQETNTVENVMFSKQLTALYQNSNFENAVTNPNSLTSSRMPSVSSVDTDKSLINKVAEQMNNLQKHLCKVQKRNEKAKELRNVRDDVVGRKTCTMHNSPYKKNAVNDTIKTNYLSSETQNTKLRISKIPKPIPVYTKPKKKLETKIPRPGTRMIAGKEIKYFTGPNNIFKSVNRNRKVQDEKHPG